MLAWGPYFLLKQDCFVVLILTQGTRKFPTFKLIDCAFATWMFRHTVNLLRMAKARVVP